MNKIAELKKLRAELVQQYKALGEKDDFDENDQSGFDETGAKIDALTARIARLENVQDIEAALSDAGVGDDVDDDSEMSVSNLTYKTGSSITPHRSNTVLRFRNKNEPKGSKFARFVIGATLMKQSPAGAMNYVREELGDREVAKALASNQQSLGGALIPQEFRDEMVSLLYSQTTVRGSGVTVYDMSRGNLTIPRMTSGAQAIWMSENVSANSVSQPAFDDINLSAKKLGAFVPVSNDLIRRSPISVENIVRTDLIKQLALAEDTAFLFNISSTNRPYGMLYWALAAQTRSVVLPTTAAPAPLASTNSLLRTMELDLEASNISLDNAKWAGHPAFFQFLNMLTDSVGNYFFAPELGTGKLLGHEFKKSNLFPTNAAANETTTTQVLLFDPSCFVIGDTLNTIVDSSDTAAYDSAGVTYSTFSRDQTVFRCISEMDFATRYPQGVSVATVENAAPSFYTANAAGFGYTTITPTLGQSAAPSAGGPGSGS